MHLEKQGLPQLFAYPKGSWMHAVACTARSLLFNHHQTMLGSQADQTLLPKENGITYIQTQQAGSSPHQSSAFTLLLSTLSFRLSYSRFSGESLWLSLLPVQHPAH